MIHELDAEMDRGKPDCVPYKFSQDLRRYDLTGYATRFGHSLY